MGRQEWPSWNRELAEDLGELGMLSYYTISGGGNSRGGSSHSILYAPIPASQDLLQLKYVAKPPPFQLLTLPMVKVKLDSY